MPTLTPAQKADVEAADQQIADEELPDGDTPQSDDEPGQVSDDDEIE